MKIATFNINDINKRVANLLRERPIHQGTHRAAWNGTGALVKERESDQRTHWKGHGSGLEYRTPCLLSANSGRNH